MDTDTRLRIVEEKLDRILALYAQENFSDKMVLYRGLQLKDKNQLTVLDSGVDGIKIGAATGKVSLYGGTPVVKAGAISNPSGGGSGSTDAIDVSGRAATTSILTVLRNLNIIAP